jgi:hypothetical protein
MLHCYVLALGQPELTEEINKILESESFRGSEMLAKLLRYLALRAVECPGVPAKEFQIATEALGRSVEFDPRIDSNVRVLTGRLRSKLMEYYATSGESDSLIIEIPKGTYVLLIRERDLADTRRQLLSDQLSTQTAEPDALNMVHDEPPRANNGPLAIRFTARRQWIRTSIAVALLLVVASTVGLVVMRRRDADDRFWSPVSSASGSVLLCMGQIQVGEATLSPNASRSRFEGMLPVCAGHCPEGNGRGFVALFDSVALADVAALLRVDKKSFTIRDQESTSFADLQKGPFVLIGAFSNDWTIRLTDPLRFHFEIDPTSQQSWIADRQNPNQRIGLNLTRTDAVVRKQDFAIVARFFDPTTKQNTIILAGLGGHATQVAGEFVTSKADLDEVFSHAPRGWDHKNVELVISTDIVDGSAGPPRVVSSYYW